jgi:hypothetical protein
MRGLRVHGSSRSRIGCGRSSRPSPTRSNCGSAGSRRRRRKGMGHRQRGGSQAPPVPVLVSRCSDGRGHGGPSAKPVAGRELGRRRAVDSPFKTWTRPNELRNLLSSACHRGSIPLLPGALDGASTCRRRGHRGCKVTVAIAGRSPVADRDGSPAASASRLPDSPPSPSALMIK